MPYLEQVRGRAPRIEESGSHATSGGNAGIVIPCILPVSVVILAVLGLGYYTVHKMRPDSFRIQTSVWRLFSFRVEIESTGMTHEAVPGKSPSRAPPRR